MMMMVTIHFAKVYDEHAGGYFWVGHENTRDFSMYDAVLQFPVNTLAVDIDLPDEVPEAGDENVVVLRQGKASIQWKNGDTTDKKKR